MNRDANGARLVGDRARDGLANPPRGVGRELVAAPVFELVGGAHQTDVALLDQVQQMQATVYVFLGHRNHQPKIGLNQVFLGALSFDFAMADHRRGVFQVGQCGAGRQFPLADFTLQFLGLGQGGLAVAAFELTQILVQVQQLVHYSLDFFAELLPLRDIERHRTHGLRDLDPTPGQSPLSALAALFVTQGYRVGFIGELEQFLVQTNNIRQLLLDFGAPFGKGSALHFEVAQVDERIQIFDFLADLFADIDHMKLY